MTRLLAAAGISALALTAAILATPANPAQIDDEYRSDYAYDCLAPGQSGGNTITYKGHIHTELTNGSGDPVVTHDYSFTDGGYTTVTFRGHYRVSGQVIHGEAWTNGGIAADLAGFSTSCFDVP